MRQRPVRTGAHRDLEGNAARAALAQEPLEVPRELGLGPADERALCEALERAIGNGARAPNRVQLLLVLDRAQRLDQVALRLGLEAPRAQHLELADRQVVALDRPGAVEEPRDVAEHEARRFDELDAADAAGGLCVAEVGIERDAVVVDPQRPVRAHEARQVADADRVRHEHPPAAEQLAQPVHACHHCLHKNSRASR